MNSAEFLSWDGWARAQDCLGPGTRLVIWLRGCSRACRGCIAPELHNASHPVPTSDIVEELSRGVHGVSGLSLTGGEPMDQPSGVARLIREIRQHPAWPESADIWLYSGYLLEDLAQMGTAHRVVLELIDVLVDGPFIEQAPNTLAFRGSDNQRIHLLSDRARTRYHTLANTRFEKERPLAVQNLGMGIIRIVGIPRRGDLDVARRALSEAGIATGEVLE